MGILDLTYTSKFFEKWGYQLHDQGRKILDDNSRTYDELVALRSNLQADSDKMPTRAPVIFRILQIASFLAAIIFTLALVVARIYS